MKNLSYKNIQVSNENSNLKVVNGALPYPLIGKDQCLNT